MIVLAALVGGLVGAVAGAWAARRELSGRVRVIAYTSQRANTAAAQAELIAAAWPEVAAKSAQADEIARRALRETQVATRQAAETGRRQQELEQAVAANFSIPAAAGLGSAHPGAEVAYAQLIAARSALLRDDIAPLEPRTAS